MDFTFNESNWRQVWNSSVGAGGGIKKLTCPEILNTNAVAILVSAPTIDSSRWYLAAYINREVRSGLVVAGTDANLDYSRRVYLNKLQILTYEIKTEFTLVANCVTKGEGVNIFAWAYAEL